MKIGDVVRKWYTSANYSLKGVNYLERHGYLWIIEADNLDGLVTFRSIADGHTKDWFCHPPHRGKEYRDISGLDVSFEVYDG